jgi:hypothetical protein
VLKQLTLDLVGGLQEIEVIRFEKKFLTSRRHDKSFLAVSKHGSGVGERWHQAGLPDFSRHNVPKRGRTYQNTTNLPNGHKIFQMGIKYISIFNSKALQNLPKLGFLF